MFSATLYEDSNNLLIRASCIQDSISILSKVSVLSCQVMDGVERLTSWSGAPGDSQAPTQRVRKLRSLSLPGPGPGLPRDSGYMKTLPSLSEVQSSRGGWEKLGLYMTGLPPKQSAKEPRLQTFRLVQAKKNLLSFSPSDTSLEELSISASNIMLSLRADQETFDARYEVQVV